jgi:hypothetical protein
MDVYSGDAVMRLQLNPREADNLTVFTLVDVSRMDNEQLAESKHENGYTDACHFNSIQQKLRTSW